MGREEIKSREIVRLTERFSKAVLALDRETVRQIVAKDLKLEFQIVSGGAIEDFDENKLEQTFILQKLPARDLRTYINQRRAKVIYEEKIDCHLAGSDFQHAFMRQTYFYKLFENEWKLVFLKTEVRRFSGYNLKGSLFNLLDCLAGKITRIVWKIRT